MKNLYHHEKMFKETPLYDDKNILSHNEVEFPLNNRNKS